MNKAEILIIDDEPQIQKLLKITLESNGFSVRQALTGKDGLMLAANHPPALILLDLGLPDQNGQQVLSELNEWYNNSIIIISIQNSENEIVKALENGASDYLVKPFRTRELIARIKSCIRRNQSQNFDQPIKSGDIEIDLRARSVKKKNKLVKMTSTEYNIMALFARNEGRVLTHQFILKEIWGIGFQTETQYLRVYVAQLRKKLENNPNNPEHIITESGVGYRFC